LPGEGELIVAPLGTCITNLGSPAPTAVRTRRHFARRHPTATKAHRTTVMRISYETESILAATGLSAPLGCHVGGKWLLSVSDTRLPIEDPATGRIFAEVVEGGDDEVDQAAEAAQRAYDGEWSVISPADRGVLLMALGQLLLKEQEALAQLESVDTGKPLSQARQDIVMAARYFTYFAGAADKVTGHTLWASKADLSYTVREPFGVVAQIIPWNSPLAQLARGVAPALAAGNTVVVKPSELAPLSSLALALLAAQANFPPGTLNVVTGTGTRAGSALAAHPLVRQITFTGSVETGRSVLRASADHIVPCTLELGGKSPTLVFPDADLADAATAAVGALRRNSGQSCSATTRILVHERVHDELLERVLEKAGRLTLGPGMLDRDLGPVISRRQLDRVLGLIDSARAQGATVASGGVSPADPDLADGYFCEPTVVAGVVNSMKVAQEEVFGPVQCLMAFTDEEEAVAIANDSAYGLSAGVFTNDFSRAHRLARKLKAGQVHINGYPLDSAETPFGGYKSSGIGREKGVQAIASYTQVKTVLARVTS